MLAGTLIVSCPASAALPVALREVDEVIPTFLAGPPDADPMFYFGRQSQGAEGRIYPYPLYNNLTNWKADQTYRLVYLENEYVKIGIVPEIGGRLFSAVDKTNNYDFVYHQHVIKPALIGLIGAWISGGIEWNIPHHHRATTFLPVQYRTEENADGSKTVWVGELEIRQRMRWAVGYTLRPGSSVLACSVRILNRTPLANSMLCFANVAVNANEHYQIIFPPRTQFVTHHFKRQFTTWPIATTPYGGVDWKGVDVSWYKNHQAANSMFAWNYWDDFFAGYDHGRQAGTLSIADHHIVPGKKFWTWGNGPRGRMWDGILTDTDGPYLELMVGAYSDNQPDYSWLQPFETRSFEMYWYPFRDIGGVKNANLDAAVNLEVKAGTATFGFYTPTAHPRATARLAIGGKTLREETIAIDPGHPYCQHVALPAGTDEHDVRASLNADGRELVAYSPVRLTPTVTPEPVTPPPAPQDIKTDEELFLAGQRIDQFHDPDRDPEPYWEEVLRRDPGDTEAHTGLGLREMRRARYAAAEEHFRQALARLTAKYTTPKNAEPLYYLGVALNAQGRQDEAFDAFYQAAWSQEWKAPAYFSLAEIASARGDFAAALDFVNRSLEANALNVRAYGLKAAVLRHLDRRQEALDVLAFAAAKTDPLDVRLMTERWLLTENVDDLHEALRSFPTAGLEVAAEFGSEGLRSDGIAALELMIGSSMDKGEQQPLAYYFLGDFAEKLSDTAKAAEYRRAAAQASPEYVFPFQAELIPVLRRAIAVNPQDARAPYYLGNLLFDGQPAEATALWEKSAALDPAFPIVWRNLAQAYAHSGEAAARAKAVACLEKAVALSDAYPTHLAELDALYASAGAPVAQRLALLEAHQGAAVKSDEGLARLISLKTFAGKTDEAIDLLQGHTFNIWEGGTRFDSGGLWTDAHLARGLQRFRARQYREALADFGVALAFPKNLRSVLPDGPAPRQAQLDYWIGCAHEALGGMDQANGAWQKAAQLDLARFGRMRNSDIESPGDALARLNAQRFHQALALRKLGRGAEAEKIFQELITSGSENVPPPGAAGSSTPPDERSRRRLAASHYAAGLGYAGLGDRERARAAFAAALTASPDDLGAKLALEENQP